MKILPVFKAHIENQNQLIFENPTDFYSHALRLGDGNLSLTIEKWRDKRSLRQNRYYRVLLNILAKENGGTPRMFGGGNIGFGQRPNMPIGSVPQTQSFGGREIGGVPLNTPNMNTGVVNPTGVSRPAPIQNSGSQMLPQEMQTTQLQNPTGLGNTGTQLQMNGKNPGMRANGGTGSQSSGGPGEGGMWRQAMPQPMRNPAQFQMPQNGGKNPQPSGSAYTQPIQPGRF